MLMLLPLQWCLAMLLAALFHELCHVLAVRLLGGEFRSMHIRFGGAVIETGALTPGRALLCCLAGPLGGMCLVLLAGFIPRIAVCALVQTCFNLLPICPLDGGRAIKAVSEMIRRKIPCKQSR